MHARVTPVSQVRLLHHFRTNERNTTWLHLVMDYMPYTLRGMQVCHAVRAAIVTMY